MLTNLRPALADRALLAPAATLATLEAASPRMLAAFCAIGAPSSADDRCSDRCPCCSSSLLLVCNLFSAARPATAALILSRADRMEAECTVSSTAAPAAAAADRRRPAR